MKKRKITTAAFLAGVTTLAVSLPAMADTRGLHDTSEKPASQELGIDYINGEDFEWLEDDSGAS